MSASESSNGKNWIVWFLLQKGNEFFCEVDLDYIFDKFNLMGLVPEVSYFRYAYDMLTDRLEDQELDFYQREEIGKSARHLYGLIHARFIVTSKGLSKMLEKYKNSEFGKCPRVLCRQQSLLPVGLTDVACQIPLRLYCPRCEDVYLPKSSRHASIDGAYFTTSFPHLFLLQFPDQIPEKSSERFIPRLFGFKLNFYSKAFVEAPNNLKEGNTQIQQEDVQEDDDDDDSSL